MTFATHAVVLAALALGGGATAAPPKPAPNPDRKVDREKVRDQIFDQIRAERMWKMTDALKLDEATAAKVFPLLSKFDDQERNLGHERGETYRELRQVIEAPSPDAARIDALINRLLALRARRQALEAEKTAALRKILKPVQMAKLMMLAPRLEEGFRQRIREAIEGTPEEPKVGADRAVPHRP
jgi:Spy/CpxP family protein refolding chaperone